MYSIKEVPAFGIERLTCHPDQVPQKSKMDGAEKRKVYWHNSRGYGQKIYGVDYYVENTWITYRPECILREEKHLKCFHECGNDG